MPAFAGIFVVAYFAIGIVQLIAGFVGIEYHLGWWWAVVAVGCALLFRFMLPLTIGTFFGAMDVWHLHWAAALLLAAPGIIFLVPAVIASMTASVRDRSGLSSREPS
jgi:hypothetical protein